MSPCATKARFASLNGTTSHTVASATRSSRPRRSGSGCAAVETVTAKRARRRHQEQKHDARGGEMSLPREIVLPVRIEHGERRRQRLVGLVMIDDDHLGAGGVGGFDGRLGRRAAIDGEDEARPFARKTGKRLGRGPVAFGEPVGNVGCRALPVGAQEALDQRDRGRAIDVVIAEHGDRFSLRDRGGKTRGRLLHVLEARRIGKKRAERWIEIAGGGVGLGTARGKHAAEQLRHARGPGIWRRRQARGPGRGARPSDSRAPSVPRRGTGSRSRLSGISGPLSRYAIHALLSPRAASVR